MKIKLSAHGAYHHQYHVVWIPKYRKKVLKGELKQYLEKGLFDIEMFYPDIEIETFSIQLDHIHLMIDSPNVFSLCHHWKDKSQHESANPSALSLGQKDILAE
jgi:putative transposase